MAKNNTTEFKEILEMNGWGCSDYTIPNELEAWLRFLSNSEDIDNGAYLDNSELLMLKSYLFELKRYRDEKVEKALTELARLGQQIENGEHHER